MSPKLFLLIFLILFTSCVSDVDFDQADDLSIQPQYVASLVNFTFNQYKFLDGLGNETVMISDATPVSLNQSPLVQNNLTKVNIQFKVTNQFNRTMLIVLRFYNAALQQTFAFNQITVLPNATNVIYTQIVEGAALQSLKNSEIARMDVVLMPNVGVPIDPNLPKSLNVQVSGIFDFNFHN